MCERDKNINVYKCKKLHHFYAYCDFTTAVFKPVCELCVFTSTYELRMSA